VIPTLSVADFSTSPSGETIVASCALSGGTLASWFDLTLTATLVGSLS
jgi:hypothetical protein